MEGPALTDSVIFKFGGWIIAGLSSLVAFLFRGQLTDIHDGIEENHKAIARLTEQVVRLDEKVKNLERDRDRHDRD